MVVPLKLTQFYGHSVPRPRIYTAVKFSERRVDPPPSVNEALLSWAADAHWSMGGLSFKRFRAQGKMEGSVRRLRAFVEEDADAPDGSEKEKAITRQAASKPAENAGKVKSTAAKEAGKPLEKKRQRSEESVEVTPARNLRRREALEESPDGASPAFVPATEEKFQKKKVRAESAKLTSRDNMKSGLSLPFNSEVLETPSSEAATGDRRRETRISSNGKTLHGSKSSAADGNHAREASPTSEGGRLTRSGITKTVREDAFVSPVQPSKGRSRARKILTRGSLTSDEESSESDDGLEAFLREKGRALRRSSRLVKDQTTSLHAALSASDSDSE